MMGIFQRFQRFMAQMTGGALQAVTHPAVGLGYLLLNRTRLNYAGMVEPRANSIVIAVIRWVQRQFSEAPPMLQRWIEDRGEWEDIHRSEVLDLLERPNPYYNGTTLFKAVIADLFFGDGYILKVRSATGRVVQLWWAPASLMEPKGDDRDPTVFISHYEYSPRGAPIPIRTDDVIHLRDGIDPENPRRGLSSLKSLLREVFTDDEAANMTASLLRNMGVPGVIISPKGDKMQMSQEAAKNTKDRFVQAFSGDKKGEPMVMEGSTEIQQFGFSPEQMQLRALRGIPEERITAVMGVNAAVVGLGAGLSTTKVGATLKEYREEAFESTIVPMYREVGAELTHQLLADFFPGRDGRVNANMRLVYDLSKVRVLQEDEMKRSERLNAQLLTGGITVAEYRRALGHPVLPEHDLYLRPSNVRQIPTGPLRIQEQQGGGETGANAASDAQALVLRRDRERLEASLETRLAQPGVERHATLQAHFLLTAEMACAAMGVDLPAEAKEAAALAAHGYQDAAQHTRDAQQWVMREAKSMGVA